MLQQIFDRAIVKKPSMASRFFYMEGMQGMSAFFWPAGTKNTVEPKLPSMRATVTVVTHGTSAYESGHARAVKSRPSYNKRSLTMS